MSDSDCVIIKWNSRNKNGEITKFLIHYKDEPVVNGEREELQEKIVSLTNRIDQDISRT